MVQLFRGALAAFLVAQALSAAAQVDQWTNGLSEGDRAAFAFTTNQDADIFGQWCYPTDGSCIWLVALNLRCEESSRYPALMNANSGAASIELLCLGSFLVEGKKYYRYGFGDFNVVDSAVRSATLIGVALPLDSGRFRVVRFSTAGANQVLDRMRRQAGELEKGSTRGTTL